MAKRSVAKVLTVFNSAARKAGMAPRKKKRRGLPASFVALLLAWSGVLWPANAAFCEEESSAPVSRPSGIGVLSLNLHEVQNHNLILANLRQAVDLDTVDLILLQEVIYPSSNDPGVAHRLAQSLALQVFFAPAFAWHKGSVQGLAILSRYPIREAHVIPLPQFNLRWRSRRRVALAAVIETPIGEMHVYNVHLDTRLNLNQRLGQLTPIVAEASKVNGAVVIAGDFNTNPFWWFQHTVPFFPARNQRLAVRQYLAKSGFKSVFARRIVTSRWLRMQLDWIFVRELRALSVSNRATSFSDHHAIYGDLEPSPEGCLTSPRIRTPTTNPP